MAKRAPLILLNMRAGRPCYAGSMVSALVRMLLALALVLAPAGMMGLSAAAAEAPVISSHCADHQGPQQRAPADGKWHCAACVAIPAQAAPEPARGAPVGTRPASGVNNRVTGLEPEVATPPPRRG